MGESTSLERISWFPLTWPEDRPRTKSRVQSQFSVTYAKAMRDLERELERWRVRDNEFVISTDRAPRSNARSPDDPGVAVWFLMPARVVTGPRELRVFACDRFKTLRENLRAIGLTLAYLRAVSRYGAYTTEQAVEGAKALPPPEHWRDVLGLGASAGRDDAEDMYRIKAKRAHPDTGGSPEAFARLSHAIEKARAELADG